MSYFLIVYDVSAGQLVEPVRAFEDEGEARGARLGIEIAYRRNRPEEDVEAVLLQAEDETTLLRTHSRYFKDASWLLAADREATTIG